MISVAIGPQPDPNAKWNNIHDQSSTSIQHRALTSTVECIRIRVNRLIVSEGCSPSGNISSNCAPPVVGITIVCGPARCRVAVMVPSPDAVYPVEVVPTGIRFVVGSPHSCASASYLTRPAATCAVTVAATSVSISSTTRVAVAAGAVVLKPHRKIRIANVADGFTWSIVLIFVPVATAALTAVVGDG